MLLLLLLLRLLVFPFLQQLFDVVVLGRRFKICGLSHRCDVVPLR